MIKKNRFLIVCSLIIIYSENIICTPMVSTKTSTNIGKIPSGLSMYDTLEIGGPYNQHHRETSETGQ